MSLLAVIRMRISRSVLDPATVSVFKLSCLCLPRHITGIDKFYSFQSGQRFAMLESKIVLSTLLRRFKFDVSPNTKPPVIAPQLVLKSMNGINLIVSRR
jgi:hypothetical protein